MDNWCGFQTNPFAENLCKLSDLDLDPDQHLNLILKYSQVGIAQSVACLSAAW